MGHLWTLHLEAQEQGIRLENPDIHCATACSRQLPIVQKILGMFPECDFHSSKVFDRCMT